MKRLLLTFMFAGVISCGFAATEAAPAALPESGTTFPLVLADLYTSVGLSENRVLLRQNLEQIVAEAFADPVPDLTSETVTQKLSGAMWACNLMQQPSSAARDTIASMLRRYSQMQESLGRATLECAYGQFPFDLTDEMKSVAQETSVPKHFAMAAVHLLRQNRALHWPMLSKLMESKWPDLTHEPILTMVRYMGATEERPARPALGALLRKDFASGKAVVYTFQRSNRDYEGVTVMRRADGRFVHTVAGNLWNIAQLTRANSNMPGFLTNGNTPQGVHTIVGVGVTKNTFIGQTPFLESALPCEHPADVYFHDPTRAGTTWTLELYKSMLPGEWRDYWPMHTAWYAGAAGRTEMLCHGTTVNPTWYVGQPYYPNTPSLGCLTAKEMWNPATGKALQSDQLELYTAWVRACQNRDYDPQTKEEPVPSQELLRGFLVVVELDDRPCAVTLSEVVTELLAAESEVR